MIEIWQECACLQKTNQILSNQVRKIITKGWFSELEILEIDQKINNKQDSKIISDTPIIYKHQLSYKNEPPTSENRNATQLNTQPKSTEQTITQNQKVN